MTEQPLLPPSMDENPEPPVTVAPKPRQRDPVPWLYGLGFLILAGAIAYVWQNPTTPSSVTAQSDALHTADQRMADLDGRLSKIEQKPAPDLADLNARLDAIDARVAAVNAKIPDQAQVGSRLDALSGRIESLSGRDQSSQDSAKQQLDALTSRVATLESNAGNVDAITKRLGNIAMIQEASLALASGRPIGELPDAPEILTRFAKVAPPTEAQLRLLFPVAEQAALGVRQPDENNAPFIDRVWDKAQGLITIRQGNNVVVGNPSATILGQAQASLTAGDLAGAIAAVETLQGQPAQAMADWLAKAKALLGARSALANMAAHA